MTVLRAGKINTNAQLGGANAHCTRKMDVPNADPALLEYNQRPVGTDNLVRDVQARLDSAGITKVRKNGVRAIEHIISASPEFFNKFQEPGGRLQYDKQRTDEFFQIAQKWVKDTYGDENLVNFTIHMDEKTPHAHAFVVPITPEGKLSARHFTGGSDGWKKLKEQQTSFSKAVEHLGLKRGQEGSKAKHQTVKNFYDKLNKSQDILAKGKKSTGDVQLIIPDFEVPKREKTLLGVNKLSDEGYESLIKSEVNRYGESVAKRNAQMINEFFIDERKIARATQVELAKVGIEGRKDRKTISSLEKMVDGLKNDVKAVRSAKNESENKLKGEIQRLKEQNNSLQRRLDGTMDKMEKVVRELKFNIKSYLKELSDRVKAEIWVFNKAKDGTLKGEHLKDAFEHSEIRLKQVDKWIQEEKDEQGVGMERRKGPRM